MTHPEEHLAGYVDGTLPAHERASVDGHLADCPRCRQEVALAASARSALGSLAEVPAPSGVAARALQEAEGAPPHRQAGGTPRWYRIAGGAAAAAAALLVITLTLPHIGRGPSSTADTAGSDAKVTTGASTPDTALAAAMIEIQHLNYDDASLSALSSSYAADTAAQSTPTPVTAESAAVVNGTPAETAKALACIVKSAPSETGQATRLISARFQGTPAYLAVFLEGPGADQPADSVVVWVFATKDCAILSFSQARL